MGAEIEMINFLKEKGAAFINLYVQLPAAFRLKSTS